MRLIDADKLKISYDGHFVGVAKNDLDSAPTVEAEPITHGQWVLVKQISKFLNYYKCSNCGHMICTTEYGLDYYKGCYCGAKMDRAPGGEEK